MAAVPCTSTAPLAPTVDIPRTQENPYGPRVRSSNSSRRPCTVSPRVLEALKVRVSQDKFSIPSSSTFISDSPLDLSVRSRSSSSSSGLISDPNLARMAFLTSYPFASFSFHSIPEASASAFSPVLFLEIMEAPGLSTSHLVASIAAVLREIYPEERRIQSIPNPSIPRVELVEVLPTDSPVPSTSNSIQWKIFSYLEEEISSLTNVPFIILRFLLHLKFKTFLSFAPALELNYPIYVFPIF